MPTGDTTTALARLTYALLSLRPLAEAGHPLRLPAATGEPAGLLAATVARDLGLVLSGPGGPDGPYADVVAQVFAGALAGTAPAWHADAPAVAEVVADTVADSFAGMRELTDVATGDRVRLRTYSAGCRTSEPPVVIASACGMPAELCEQWIRHLSRDHYVVTWETRGMFGPLGPDDAFDRTDVSLDAQGRDLIAVLDHHEIESAHVMGLCGGAVVALSAAAQAPQRVSSMSLWHGDFSGSPGPVTSHQNDLKALLAMAGESRLDAAVINTALSQTALENVPADVAHLVVYPYANDELFYRYCRLTGATMTTDVSALLPGVRVPTLVVTSEDDHTAHPGGSHRAAELIPGAQLRVEPHGDHISVFGAGPRLRSLMTSFLSAQR